MTISIAVAVVAALAFGMQWTTNRWWIALLVPSVLIILFAWIGSSGPNGHGAILGLWSDFLMASPIFLTLCACGALAARTLKNRGRNRPALDSRFLHWVAVLFAVYGGYLVYVALSFPNYFILVGAAASFTAAIALWRGKSWAQYLVYSISISVIVWWGWSAWQAAENGTWKPETLDQAVLALLPGFMFLGVAAASCVVAYRSFHSRGPAVK